MTLQDRCQGVVPNTNVIFAYDSTSDLIAGLYTKDCEIVQYLTYDTMPENAIQYILRRILSCHGHSTESISWSIVNS